MSIAMNVAMILAAVAFWPTIALCGWWLIRRRSEARARWLARRYPGPWTL